MSYLTYTPKLKSLLAIALCSLLYISCNVEQQSTSDNTVSQEKQKKEGTALQGQNKLLNVPQVQSQPLALNGFEIMSADHTGVKFQNNLDINKIKSHLYYVNVFNGGGVALGDINNDGLIDIYLTGNLVGNRLYLNKGNLQFEDITISAGVGCNSKWSTGATFADVNNDGLLDLYVCHSYDDEDANKRANSLFINQGENKFIEKAKKFGLADVGYSIQASFLDYDKDGDLDMFLGNTPRYVTGGFFFFNSKIHTDSYFNPKDLSMSDKLYQNNGDGTFTDVTVAAGILNYGYMLGVSVADYNGDGWDDIFVAVDHTNPDYLYINNKNGTFRNEVHKSFKHISLSSMGTDAADLNNDSKIDLVTLDMLPLDNYSEKTQMGNMDPLTFNMAARDGLHYNYMRNMLQLNQGNGRFTEIGQMAGIHKTDWSWSVVAADFSNDGHKDLFVTNGYYKTILDKDTKHRFGYVLQKTDPKDYKAAVKKMEKNLKPQRNRNVLFKNNGDYTFDNISKAAGCDEDGFSSGSAYADLDNDGDLDLVVNNIDRNASILRNKQRENGEGNFIQLNLNYKNNLPSAGTKIEVSSCHHRQYYEYTYSRGYQSSYTGPTHVGIGVCNKIDYVKITWPDGKVQIFNDIKINEKSNIAYKPSNEAHKINYDKIVADSTFVKISPTHIHKENVFDDFKHQILLPHKMSQLGPATSKGDVNQDGYEDFFVGGPVGQEGSLFLYNQNNKKYEKQGAYFDQHKQHEDLGSVFFDLENDGDLDLYVVSGGNEYMENSLLYKDRVYINNGKGEFTYSQGALPDIALSGGCVKANDYDNDGYMDLFVGTRLKPRSYPFSSYSYILKNNNGKLELGQKVFSESPKDMGMVTDACFADINNDKQDDLVIVGEWMPITILINQNGKFINKTKEYNLTKSNGWWNCIEKADLDNDGDVDFVLGNLGLNYKYKASEDKPFHVYAGDFDKNGKSDIVLGQYYLDELCPVRGRQCSSQQMPSIARKFPSYEDFGKANLETVYGEYLDDAYHLQVSDFRSSILVNEEGSFSLKSLPQEAQFSPINSIVLKDLNNDNLIDILAGGNLFVSEVETGRADGGIGLVLLQNKDGSFESISSEKSGLFIDKDVRSLTLINDDGILVGNNHANLQFYNIRNVNL